MIQDKSTRFTLAATAILLLALFFIAWWLTRAATSRRDAATRPKVVLITAPTGAAAAPVPVPPADSKVPTLPLDTNGQPLAEYQVITGVTLEENADNEGDTFLLKTPQGAHRFCLYFADTVETNGGQPQAASEMAGYFELDSEERLRGLGLEALEFSLRLLRSNAFRVVTRWEKNPEGDAYYCFIYLNDPDQKTMINLAQGLVRYGLARIVPCERNQPDGTTAAQFRDLLVKEETRSKEESHGAWNRKSP